MNPTAKIRLGTVGAGWHPGGEEVTNTHELRRGVLEERCAAVIEEHDR